MHFRMAAFALVLAWFSVPAGAQTFVNRDRISIPDNGITTSSIDVAGLLGRITGLSLTLDGVSHSYSQDLVFGLVAEDLQRGLVFWSGAGGANAVSNATVTFRDSASGLLPFPAFDLGPVTSGSYRASNWFSYGINGVTDVISFADFNGLDPNGRWTLLAFDTAAGDVGLVDRGWSLGFTTTGSGGAVPEPATWAMLIGGLALAGAALRRRRRPSMPVSCTA
ncbi:PEPxxWA-CTERM sorting domain-containing protein [Sphingomonas pokkalii]|uniref:Ice-binding protein C-terminal domain-containing protein n=1 Tax=Sphingomonas pokkalii TaxID=2175090 RepID=A0A2U0SB26_9SPHN|nr:PEPxxWA-CTERM sorting domain-containing protein [Sphingomonas pokkalii]PVX28471.1 hypothetical protein DD559_03225 [Sphingomonas pokkalii]